MVMTTGMSQWEPSVELPEGDEGSRRCCGADDGGEVIGGEVNLIEGVIVGLFRVISDGYRGGRSNTDRRVERRATVWSNEVGSTRWPMQSLRRRPPP